MDASVFTNSFVASLAAVVVDGSDSCSTFVPARSVADGTWFVAQPSFPPVTGSRLHSAG